MPESEDTLDTSEIPPGGRPSPGLRTRRGTYLYNNRPVYILGSGLEGVRQDLGMDLSDLSSWLAYIELLASLQTEHTRFRLRFNPWAFCFDKGPLPLTPWTLVAGRYNLMQYNEPFWELSRKVAEAAHARGLLFEFVLFDGYALEQRIPGERWARHPFNVLMGGPLEQSLPYFYHLPDPQNLTLWTEPSRADWPASRMAQFHQQRFVWQAITQFSELENVCWEITRAIDGADPVRTGFVRHFIAFLRQYDPLDRLVSCSGRNALLADEVYYRLTGIDAVHFHATREAYDPCEQTVETIIRLRQFGKPVMCDETDWSGQGSHAVSEAEQMKRERWSFWHAFVAGGSSSAARWQPLRRRSLHDWLQVFAGFIDGCAFWEMRYNPTLVLEHPVGIYAHAAAGPGEVIVYLTTDAPADEGKIMLKLPTGIWSGVWVYPRSGQAVGEVLQVQSDGVAATIPEPPFIEDLALRLTKEEKA